MFASLTPTSIMLLLAPATIIAICYLKHIKGQNHLTKHPGLRPLVVNIPAVDMFCDPKHAYEKVLSELGNIVGVQRKGRLEYIVDDTLTREVLTSNDSFSFEEGTAKVLNLQSFYHLFPHFFSDLDDLVKTYFIDHIDSVIAQVSPIFMKRSNQLLGSKEDRIPLDSFSYSHKCIAEAMASIIFGAANISEQNISVLEKVAAEIAELTGIYQNTSYFARTFPTLWTILTWIRVIFTSVLSFFRTFGPLIWTALQNPNSDYEHGMLDSFEASDLTVLEYLSLRELQNGRARMRSFFRVASLLLGIIFASVHQTASVVVWVVFEIAKRPEVLQQIRDEFQDCVAYDSSIGCHIIDYSALQSAKLLDSFIREVLRTKGDTLSTARMSTKDTKIGSYIVPKGFLVIPLASLSHMSTKYHGSDAHKFKADRWVSTGKQAVALSPQYFPFGLGRWACPGRILAVCEIKLIVWSIVHIATPRLEGNSYRVTDPMNVTSVPPCGDLELVFRARSEY